MSEELKPIRGKTTYFTIEINKELKDKVKILAHQNGIKMWQIVERGFREFIEEMEKKK